MNSIDKRKAYNNARKKVKKERAFYKHIAVYLIMNSITFIVILKLKDYIYDNYLIWNLISSPLLWGIVLLGHGLWIFRGGNSLKKSVNKLIPIEKWEQRKIKEFMNENNHL